MCWCSSVVAATCDALSITSLVARKLLGASFSLVRKCAGKPLLHWHKRQITRNNFMDKGRKANLSANTSQNFALVCLRCFTSIGSTSHLLSFVSMP